MINLKQENLIQLYPHNMSVIIKIVNNMVEPLIKYKEKEKIVVIIKEQNILTHLLFHFSMQQDRVAAFLSKAVKEKFIGTMSLLEP